MIKYSKDWTKTSSIDVKNSTYTLAEFIKEVMKNVQEGTKDEDILLDFQTEAFEDYNLYGEIYTSITSELEISIKK